MATECGNCDEVVVLSCGSGAETLAVLEELLGRLRGSVEKHGDWSDYDVDQVFEAVAGEFDEYREAVVGQMLTGRHGQVDELYDLAAVALKGVRRLVRLVEEVEEVAESVPVLQDF